MNKTEDQNKKHRIIRVIGHKNPDTDSICSAISYAYLKNQISDVPHEPRRAGNISKETGFVLDYFGIQPPRLSVDASPDIGNIDIRREKGIDGEMSLREAWKEMGARDIDTLCIVEAVQGDAQDKAPADESDFESDGEAVSAAEGAVNLKGLITIRDIADANMNLMDQEVLAKSRTTYRNLASVLDGKLLVGDENDVITKGKLSVGTSPEVMDGFITPGDIILVTNRYETQICAIDNDAGCLVVCTGASISEGMLRRCREKGIAVISTELDTLGAARIASMAAPVRYYMKSSNLVTFNINTPVEEARKVMASTRHRYFPIMDRNGHFMGVLSRRNMLNIRRKRFILVDHNEKEQAVDGLEEAEILEIIDHHRLGDLQTGGPVYFRNEPVGCTSTILYSIYQENEVEIPREIAGLMLSAILSDTLIFHSPTCTGRDKAAAKALAKIAGVDIETYGRAMFEAGEDLTGRTAEEVLTNDFKEFSLGEYRVSVGQGFYMTTKAFGAAALMVSSILQGYPEKTGVNIVMYIVTSIVLQGSLILYAGKDADEVVRAAYLGEGNEPAEMPEFIPEIPGGKALWVPGIVSRKKQVIPPLREKLLEK